MARGAQQGKRVMRLALAALLTPLLAACGSGGPSGVDFERPVGAVYGALAAVDGQVDMRGLLRSPVVARRQAADDRLVFILGQDGAEHHGELTFRFHKLDEGRTRVSVDAALPEIKTSIGGETKVLSESKVETLLTQRLQALAKRMNEGKLPAAALDELDQAIAFTALALDPREINRALELANNDAALSAAMEHEAAWRSDSASETDAAGAAIDDTWGEEAAGTDASGVEPVGTDPEPVSDFGG
jgi:hypothetical protein